VKEQHQLPSVYEHRLEQRQELNALVEIEVVGAARCGVDQRLVCANIQIL
jgi:hypothetical protein